MARAGRRLLYAAATSDRLEGLVTRSAFLRRRALAHARRYVAGETLADALTTTRTLVSQGLAVSVDRFGEGLHDREAIGAIVDEYCEMARAIANVDGDLDLEVVPSHLGIDLSVEYFCEQIRQIAAVLPEAARLEISAEESHRTPGIVDAELALAAEGVPVVATLQANLRRTASDARRLVDAQVPIRLVKGAYLEPANVAYPWGRSVDVAFVRLAHQINHDGGRLTLATHDAVIREALLPAVDGVGIEMLLGVHTEDAVDLLARGHHVRIYVPYGSEWFRYWMRRVARAAAPDPVQTCREVTSAATVH
ncbi:proline dehydrogenase [Egibacter rhizosphaerae]|uniref:Proline dehydrogenase n=1 Tax=Egibacter rhizosphaerae TaxID=1670831 RepID=A0A411YG79_9ACTN|nr:proline dehydrogenase family protein [Egibacter rhizosphaerae]QBI20228.1 proline dehydrogenase [Egibacter rhizosphaerae]